LGETKRLLKAQMMLGYLLRRLDRDAEALPILLETLTRRLSTDISALNHTAKVFSLLHKVFSRMEPRGDPVDVTASLLRLQEAVDQSAGRRTKEGTLKISLRIFELGSGYSKLKEFKCAEICFGCALKEINDLPRRDPMMMAEAHKEYSLHFRRRNEQEKSLQHLKSAFEQLLSADRHVETLANELESLFNLAKLETETDPGLDPSQILAWWRLKSVHTSYHYRKRVPLRQKVTLVRVPSSFSPNPSKSPTPYQHPPSTPNINRSDNSTVSTTVSSESASSTSSMIGTTYSAGSISIVSNSEFMFS